MFARANVARRAGMMAEAAKAYADVIARFPNDDSRAAIAAFELGRIRMDALSDPRGAIKAFNRSLRVRQRSQPRGRARSLGDLPQHAARQQQRAVKRVSAT